jgi:hypothetical protein
MSVKKQLQQLMGGTSDIKEAFSFPGMGEIYSKNAEKDGDEAAAEEPAAATKSATKPAAAAAHPPRA